MRPASGTQQGAHARKSTPSRALPFARRKARDSHAVADVLPRWRLCKMRSTQRATASVCSRRRSRQRAEHRLPRYRRCSHERETAAKGVKRLRAGRAVAGVGAGAAAWTLHRHQAAFARLSWALQTAARAGAYRPALAIAFVWPPVPSGRVLCHALSSLPALGGTTASPGRCACRTARGSRQLPRCCSHRT